MCFNSSTLPAPSPFFLELDSPQVKFPPFQLTNSPSPKCMDAATTIPFFSIDILLANAVSRLHIFFASIPNYKAIIPLCRDVLCSPAIVRIISPCPFNTAGHRHDFFQLRPNAESKKRPERERERERERFLSGKRFYDED